jgi:hypothetical protein
MVAQDCARQVLPMDEPDAICRRPREIAHDHAITRLPQAMAAHGRPVDDLSDIEIVARARALVPYHHDPVARVLKTLAEP